jgi:hypothetical protein
MNSGKRKSAKRLFITLFTIAILALSFGASAQDADVHPQNKWSNEEHVLVPLVEENGNTGIPMIPMSDYVIIELVHPEGEELHIPLIKDDEGLSNDMVLVIIVHKGGIDTEKIAIQDWPQSGWVIPLSQDWPQGGQLMFELRDHPDKSFLCMLVHQDWPQYVIDGTLM